MRKKEIAMLENPFLFWMDRLYGTIVKLGSNLQSLFLLYMRITWGHQFILVGLLHDNPLETIGGVLLIGGLLSRLISVPLLIKILIELTTAHKEHLSNLNFIFDPHSLAGSNPYPFLITTLMVLVFGPGRISIDAWIKCWVSHQPKY